MSRGSGLPRRETFNRTAAVLTLAVVLPIAGAACGDAAHDAPDDGGRSDSVGTYRVGL